MRDHHRGRLELLVLQTQTSPWRPTT